MGGFGRRVEVYSKEGRGGGVNGEERAFGSGGFRNVGRGSSCREGRQGRSTRAWISMGQVGVNNGGKGFVKMPEGRVRLIKRIKEPERVWERGRVLTCCCCYCSLFFLLFAHASALYPAAAAENS